MKSLLSLLTCFLLLVGPALADAATASSLAERLSQSHELPVNVRLRMEILSDQLPQARSEQDFSNLLSFFSTTRVMVWSESISEANAQTMARFEQQMVQLASQKGRSLDLPPVGYSPLTVATTAAGTPAGSLITNERSTRAGLADVVLHTERLATENLGSAPLANDLLYLRDSLTALRQDIADPAVAPESLRTVLLARARYLAGNDPKMVQDPRLLDSLNTLSEMIRSTFPAERIRSAAPGQQISYP